VETMTKRRSKDLPPARCIGLSQQPIQMIRWVERDDLHANSYNPNHVAPVELQLLRISLLLDGWTQPLIVREDGEIVDGYHRWMLSAEPEIGDMTNGLVPVVQLNVPLDHQMASTLRYARARGGQGVVRMAELVRSLIDSEGMTPDDLRTLLQMETEEIERLYDRSGVVGRAGKSEFNKGWIPE
jgi:ParB-like chromosome segregation protein Spo0J